jgi:hypothetical protein
MGEGKYLCSEPVVQMRLDPFHCRSSVPELKQKPLPGSKDAGQAETDSPALSRLSHGSRIYQYLSQWDRPKVTS